jgi:hypothetical protein
MEIEMFVVCGYINNFCGFYDNSEEYYSNSLKVNIFLIIFSIQQALKMNITKHYRYVTLV